MTETATTTTMSVYDAAEVLFEHRHDLPSDILRTIQNVWTCASQARFGEPYEAFWEHHEWTGTPGCDCEKPDDDLQECSPDHCSCIAWPDPHAPDPWAKDASVPDEPETDEATRIWVNGGAADERIDEDRR